MIILSLKWRLILRKPLFDLLISMYLALFLSGMVSGQRICQSSHVASLSPLEYIRYSIHGDIIGTCPLLLEMPQRKLIKMSSFNDSIPKTLRWEGGYSSHPSDPGGETNFGISKSQYPYLDIKNLTKEEAKAIYFRDYWTRNRIGEVKNQDIANLVFDMVVNHGQAGRIIQQTLVSAGQNVIVDNAIGSNTIAALNRVSAFTFIPKLVSARKRYYDTLIERNPTLATFKKGWYNRASFFLFSRPVKIAGTITVLTIIMGTWYYLRNR